MTRISEELSRVARFVAIGALFCGQASAEPQPLIAVHSGLCLGGQGRPAVEPCDGRNGVTLLPVFGQGDRFMMRSEKLQACLFSNRDGRFGWYRCTAQYTDQHWSFLTAPAIPDGEKMLRATHSGKCLFSNADGRFGLYTCVVEYGDQRWRLGSATRASAPRIESPAQASLAGDWDWMDGAATAFHGDGTFMMPNDSGGTWRALPGGRFQIRWPNGRIDQVILSAAGTLEGRGFVSGVEQRVSARRAGRAPSVPPQVVAPRLATPAASPGQPAPAPAPSPTRDAYSCDSAADCVIFCPSVPGCCGATCGCNHAIRRDHVAAYDAEYKRTCARPPSCPVVGCAYHEAAFAECRDHRCVPSRTF